MNAIERCVYNAIKKNPVIKNFLVDVYQRICAFVPVKNITNDYSICIRPGFFFGFHDKCPWSFDNHYLLAHRYNDHPLSMPRSNDVIDVGYFAGDNYRAYHCLGKTKAWNWQMGAMLQWVGDTHHIIFNDYDGEKNISRIIDIHGKELRTFDLPIAAVSPNGKLALSHSFERLRKGSYEYAYVNGVHEEEADNVPESDGLTIFDLNSGSSRQLVRIKELYKKYHEPSMDGAYHFFSHCQFSPKSDRFMFYHRWRRPNQLLKTRMISYSIASEKLHIFPTSGMVSHACWRDNEHILAYASTKSSGDKYYLFKDSTAKYSVIGADQFKVDGHPQFSQDGRRILTDTYPDRFRMQSLIVYNVKENQLKIILKLRIPLKFRYGVRCDFHPRWNRDSTMICFDSAHTGKRALCLLKYDD